jgi:hypothetical protein
MARSTGLLPRRGVTIDANTVLVGSVLAGTLGRPAETRTGAARILSTRLDAQDVFKIIVYGNASAAGKYTIEVAHVPVGSTVPATYAAAAVISLKPGYQEIALTGVNVRELARVAGSVTGDVRVMAIRATAGTAGDAPAGVNTIFLDYAS